MLHLYRTLFRYVKVLIIDEKSMIGAQLLAKIDLRLKQITGNYKIPFGNILGCSKSFESDIYRAVEEPKFLRHFKISSFIGTYPKCHSTLSIHCLFTSHLKLTCQCIFVQWKKPNIVQ